MVKFLEKKGGKLSLTDAMLIAGTKTISEKLLARVPLVGNASYQSGFIKIAGAMGLNQFVGGKTGDILGTALMVDGAEDVANKLIGNFLGSGNSNGRAGSRQTI